MSENRNAIENVNSDVCDDNIDCLKMISSVPNCFFCFKKIKKAFIPIDMKPL